MNTVATRPALEKFENVIIGYMFNQAGMPFFRVGSYPAYTIEDGRLVQDNSQEAKDFQARARETKNFINRAKDRQSRGIRIPKTWIRRIVSEETLVQVLLQERVIVSEWADEYFRLVRFLKQLEG